MWSLELESRVLHLAVERGLVDPGAEVVGGPDWMDPAKVQASSCWGPRLDALLRAGALDEKSLHVLALDAVQEGELPTPLTPLDVPSYPALRDRFQDLEQIGEGATAHVFRAFDTVMQRWVALKQLKSTHPGHRQRLLNEARAQAQVDHPHVCKVFDVAESGGEATILLQLAEGGTLVQARERLNAEEKARLVLDVAQGVHAAHQRGLLHLDLKPGNILIQADGDRLHPLVGDFGMVRSQGAGFCPMGTPPYSSPEQLNGDLAHVDARSDVYALGMVLYVLLAGRFPFEAGSFPELLEAARTALPKPLPKERNPWGRDADAILGRCLAKRPEGRYATAQALAEDLDRLLKKLPVIARAGGVLYRLGRWRSRNPRLALASTALTFSLAVGGVATYQAIQARRQGEWAQHFEAEAAELEAYVKRIYTLPPHDMTAEMDVARDKVRRLEEAIARIRGLAQGPAHYALGRAYRVLDAFTRRTRSLEHLQKAYDLGFRTGEVRIALAEALLRRYEDFQGYLFNYATALTDQALAVRTEAIRRKWLEPAQGLLQGLDARGKAWAPRLEMLQAMAARDLERYLRLAEIERDRTPWDFEAWMRVSAARDIVMSNLQQKHGFWRTGTGESIPLPADIKSGIRAHMLSMNTESQRIRALAPGLPLLAPTLDLGALWDIGVGPEPDLEGAIQEARSNAALDHHDPARQQRATYLEGFTLQSLWSAHGKDPRSRFAGHEPDTQSAEGLPWGAGTALYSLTNWVLYCDASASVGEVKSSEMQGLAQGFARYMNEVAAFEKAEPSLGFNFSTGHLEDIGLAIERSWDGGLDPSPFLLLGERAIREGSPSDTVWSRERGEAEFALVLARWRGDRGEEPKPLLDQAETKLEAFQAQPRAQSPTSLLLLARSRSTLARLRLAWEPTPLRNQEAREAMVRLAGALDGDWGTASPWTEKRRAPLELARLALALGAAQPPELANTDPHFRGALEMLRKVFAADPEIPELEAERLLRCAGPKGPSSDRLAKALDLARNALVYPRYLTEAEAARGLKRPIPLAYGATAAAHPGRTHALIGEIQMELAKRADPNQRARWAREAKASLEKALHLNRNLEHRVRPLLEAAKAQAAPG